MIALTLARKPLAGRTVASTVVACGTGALNIEACRVGTSKQIPGSVNKARTWIRSMGAIGAATKDMSAFNPNPNLGRWPANLMFSDGVPLEPGIRIFKVFPGSG